MPPINGQPTQITSAAAQPSTITLRRHTPEMYRFYAVSVIILHVLCLSTEAARLQIVEASAPGGVHVWRKGPLLGERLELCRADMPYNFTVMCFPEIEPRSVAYAIFSVNNVFRRREKVKPYTLTGDRGGVARPWLSTAPETKITCVLSNGEATSSILSLRCPVATAGVANIVTPIVLPSLSPSPLPSPSSTSVAAESALPSPSIPVPNKLCVKIAALSYLSKSNGWIRRDNGLEYKPYKMSKSIDAMGSEPVEYTFVAPVSSHYGLSVDMTTSGVVDYNDIWIRFPYGDFTLRKGQRVKSAFGWIKGFHNRRGRLTKALSTDHDGHTISTRKMLEAGGRYRVLIGGRSSKVTVHHIIMFPCGGLNCAEGYFWKRRIRECTLA